MRNFSGWTGLSHDIGGCTLLPQPIFLAFHDIREFWSSFSLTGFPLPGLTNDFSSLFSSVVTQFFHVVSAYTIL